jgi:serine phosphatase RsbU (regulator of sigma subunit)
MKKTLLIVIFLVSGITLVNAQFYTNLNFSLTDSLLVVKNTEDNSVKLRVLGNIGYRYIWSQGDSAIKYFKIGEEIAIVSKDERALYRIYGSISGTYSFTLGNYPLALHFATEQLKLGKKLNLPDSVMRSAYNNLTFSYAHLNNKDLAFKYIILAYPFSSRNIITTKKNNLSNLAKAYYILGQYDSAYHYNKLTLDYVIKNRVYEKRPCNVYVVQGDIYRALNKYDSAIINYKLSIPLAFTSSLYKDYLEATSGLTSTYAALNQVDSAIYYGNQVVTYSKTFTFTEGLLNTYKVLYKMYKVKNKLDSSFKYLELSQQLSEQLYNSSKINEAQNIALGEETKSKELAEQKAEQQKQLIAIFVALLIVTIVVYVNVKRRQKNKIKKIEEDRKNNELSAARDLQISMLPKKEPQRDDLDIASFIRSSTEVGGDYYDFFEHKGSALYSVCGDATGHGVASGMMVSVTKAGLNGIDALPANTILHKLNNVVKNIDLGTLRMSLNIVQIKPTEFELSSAAMPPVYHYVAATNKVEEILIEGLPLGGLKDEHFNILTRNFNTGDIIVQLSDGLPEAPNLTGELYDYERLGQLIEINCSKSAQGMIDSLIASVDSWLQGKHNPDDITLVVIKKK